jgi:spore coat protein U-like protein
MKIALFGFAMGFLAMGLTSSSALAATSTASFSVTATVVSGCQASSPASAFGTQTAARVALSSVSVTCTNPTAYNVSLSAGRTADAAATTATESKQEMSGSASELLGHGLLPDLVRTGSWGRPAGGSTVAGIGGGHFLQYAAYGKAAGAQPFVPNPYADLITITVTY